MNLKNFVKRHKKTLVNPRHRAPRKPDTTTLVNAANLSAETLDELNRRLDEICTEFNLKPLAS